MADWHLARMEDDLRPRMTQVRAEGTTFALATITASDGGPRPTGAQMLITAETAYGFLSGGCIEDDVALHARRVIADGASQRLVYGRGSPFIDMRLPCGGRLDVLVERIFSDDPALLGILDLAAARRPATYYSDGVRRAYTEKSLSFPYPTPPLLKHYLPVQRLVVLGDDPFALSIAGQGARMGWDVLLVAPFGPMAPPPEPIRYDRSSVSDALASVVADPWTAIAVATHDMDVDHEALAVALRSRAGYVGVLGARRRLPERLARLRAEGPDDAAIARLHAPIGLAIGSANAFEVAVSVIGEIVAHRSGAKSISTIVEKLDERPVDDVRRFELRPMPDVLDRHEASKIGCR